MALDIQQFTSNSVASRKRVVMPENELEDLYRHYASTHTSNAVSEGSKRHEKWFPVTKYLPTDRSVNILDVGCGAGEFLEQLVSLEYKNLHGVDISPEQVEAAKLRLNGFATLACQDIFDFFTDNSMRWDLVVLEDVLEHFSVENAIRLVHLISDRLSTRGRIIIQVPNASSPFFGNYAYADLTHLSIYNARSIKQLAKLCNLEIVSINEVGIAPGGGMKRFIRRIAFGVTSRIIRFMIVTETGDRSDVVVSQNLIFIGQPVQSATKSSG